MPILVLGASGKTGRLVVQHLLDSGYTVKAIVRDPNKLPESWHTNDKLILIRQEIADVGVDELADYLSDCSAAVCCLGHNPTFKGMFGKPRRLVTTAVTTLCKAIQQLAPQTPFRFVLMNTAGNRNRLANEHLSFGDRIVVSLLRFLLPPQADNECAADHLACNIGQNNPSIEWVAVRPDTLRDEVSEANYSVHPSPLRSAIFNPGVSRRVHVAHFMTQLITDDATWAIWKGQMPVIYTEL